MAHINLPSLFWPLGYTVPQVAAVNEGCRVIFRMLYGTL